MKKYLSIALAALLVVAAFALVACDPNSTNGGKGASVSEATISDASLKIDTTKPIYLTTVGQGSTYNTLKLMLDGLLTAEGYTADTLLKAENVEAGATVFIAPHHSSKGMGGSSGIDAASELARAQAFAARKDITIVLIVNDRGTNSDKYLQELLPAANVVLFTAAQNEDGKVAQWAGEGKTIYQTERLSNMQNSVKFLLGK